MKYQPIKNDIYEQDEEFYLVLRKASSDDFDSKQFSNGEFWWVQILESKDVYLRYFGSVKITNQVIDLTDNCFLIKRNDKIILN